MELQLGIECTCGFGPSIDPYLHPPSCKLREAWDMAREDEERFERWADDLDEIGAGA